MVTFNILNHARSGWKNLILWVIMFHVVIYVEQTEFKIKIDKQGRLVIPSRVRKAIGYKW